jgi:hypothetical protein
MRARLEARGVRAGFADGFRRALLRASDFTLRLDKSDGGSRGRNNNLRQALENHKAISAASMRQRYSIRHGCGL